jgi:LacI family transcriptional regulator
MERRLRVALLIESSLAYGRGLLLGIGAYSRDFGPWTFYQEERSIGDPMPARLASWQPDGVLARVEQQTMARQLRRLKVPVVDLRYEGRLPGAPEVLPDQQAIVRLAVDHLLSCGLREFAYCGFPGLRFSEERQQYFVEYVTGKKYPVHVFRYRGHRPTPGLATTEAETRKHLADLLTWLQGLPKPLGVMACNDMRATHVLSVCAEAGFRVPEAVAVVGVDNDLVLCELSDPPLSTVDPAAERVGYEAAAVLHRMIEGRGPVPKTTWVDPTGVVRRKSTDVLAVADPNFIEILRHVRAHACEGLTVEELASQMALSRGTLERWFARNLGCSPNAEILRLRIERAKELLASANLAIEKIGRLSGFRHIETFYRVFQKAVGRTPGQYRDRHR